MAGQATGLRVKNDRKRECASRSLRSPGQIGPAQDWSPCESQLNLQWTKGCGREGPGYDSEAAAAVGFLQAPSRPLSSLILLFPVGWRQVYLFPVQAIAKAP